MLHKTLAIFTKKLVKKIVLNKINYDSNLFLRDIINIIFKSNKILLTF